MRKRLAKAIWKSGVTSPDLLAEYLIREGWSDTSGPRVIVTPSVPQVIQIPQVMQTPQARQGRRWRETQA